MGFGLGKCWVWKRYSEDCKQIAEKVLTGTPVEELLPALIERVATVEEFPIPGRLPLPYPGFKNYEFYNMLSLYLAEFVKDWIRDLQSTDYQI